MKSWLLKMAEVIISRQRPLGVNSAAKPWLPHQSSAPLPDFAVEAIREAMPNLGRKLSGFDRDDALMTAVETRSSSPVRFARNEQMEGTLAGFTRPVRVPATPAAS